MHNVENRVLRISNKPKTKDLIIAIRNDSFNRNSTCFGRLGQQLRIPNLCCEEIAQEFLHVLMLSCNQSGFFRARLFSYKVEIQYLGLEILIAISIVRVDYVSQKLRPWFLSDDLSSQRFPPAVIALPVYVFPGLDIFDQAKLFDPFLLYLLAAESAIIFVMNPSRIIRAMKSWYFHHLLGFVAPRFYVEMLPVDSYSALFHRWR